MKSVSCYQPRSVAGPISLTKQAEDLLQRAPYFALRGVRCEDHEGVLILRGRVLNYHMKQVAQVLVAQLNEVELIDNRIEVLRS